MRGRSHEIVGAVAACCAAAPVVISKMKDDPAGLTAYTDFIDRNLNPLIRYNTDLTGILMACLCIFLYFLGVILPDIDLKASTISSAVKFHIPVTHRGFTHSLWLVLIMAIAGIYWWYPLRFLAIGMLVHDLCDSLSKAGWVPFYPLGRYKVYKGTIMVRNKYVYMYSSDKPSSETVCVCLLVALCVGILVTYLYIAL